MGFTVVCTFHENIMRISMHCLLYVRIRHALADSHTHSQYVVAHASLFELGRMPSNQRKIQASTRCKRCLWNANVIKFGFHMGKMIETNEQIHHRLMACARKHKQTRSAMHGMFVFRSHKANASIEWLSENETHTEMEHKLGDDEKWS